MNYSELHRLETIGYANSPESLAALLNQAVITPSTPFTHHGRARGGPCSCHLLSQDKTVPHTVIMPKLPWPHPIEEIAQEFFNPALVSETRRDPVEQPTPDSQKGWKVSKMISEGKTIVVVEACWTAQVRFPLF